MGRGLATVLVAGLVSCSATGVGGDAAGAPGWVQGKGWGWIWGADDEVGSLNALTDDTRLAALRLVTRGKVYDLGVPYDRRSFKWPGHNPAEIMTFRSPEGEKRMADPDYTDTPSGTAWHSCALFLSDNVGTQIDSLGHVVVGEDNHWYNGFKESQAGGDWGIRRCDALSIPPVIVRGVLLDVAGAKNVEALPAHYGIGPDDLKAALTFGKVNIKPGDAVFIRTGVLRYWGEAGADHEKLRMHDSAGITLDAARWLVEEKGAILVASDTSGLEQSPAPEGSDSFIPVHTYLLVKQGVHIGELHYLEDLARDKVYIFCYVALTNKIRGTTAGFTMRPVALR